MAIYNCATCGNEMRVKPCHVKKIKHGLSCSRSCLKQLRSKIMTGDNNHQFGLTGDQNASFKGELTRQRMGYIFEFDPTHPRKDTNKGWYRQHRLIVERDEVSFPDEGQFDYIDGRRVLRPQFDVHHLNECKADNRVENLEVITRSAHTSLHNSEKHIVRDRTSGRIIGVVKPRELLENPGEGNQQPSQTGDRLEGSETRDRDSQESVMSPRVRGTRKRDDIVRTARIPQTSRRRS